MTRSRAGPDGGDFEFYSCADQRSTPRAKGKRNPLEDGCGEAEFVTFDGYWQCQALTEPCSQANAICAWNVGNDDFLAVKTQVSQAFGTHDYPARSTSSSPCWSTQEFASSSCSCTSAASQLGYGFSAAIFRIAPISRAPKGVAPHPVPDFRHVLTVPGNILLVLEEFVLELLLQVDALVAGLR